MQYSGRIPTGVVLALVAVAAVCGQPKSARSQNDTASAQATSSGAASSSAASSNSSSNASGEAKDRLADAEKSSTAGTIPETNLLRIMQGGGLLMFPILLCSFVLAVFVFERTISLRRGRVIPRPFVKRFLHQLREGELDQEEAAALCDESRSPVAMAFAGAVRKWGRPAVEVEQATLDAGERAVSGLRRYLRVLNGVATVTPLLGLLGTVVGMIRAFNSIATSQAMGRPELLANGISQALLTTAGGLTVAIPALIFYLYFVGRVDKHTIEIDALAQEVVDIVSAEGLKEQTASRSSKSRRRAA
jgi:biopolymer transport protein ExbB